MRLLEENLLLRFSVVSFAIMFVMAMFLAIILSNKIRSDAINDLVDEAVGSSQGRLLRAITPADLEVPMSAERYNKFNEFVLSSIVSDRIALVKLWAKDGTIIYSTEREEVGARFPGNENLLIALRGEETIEGLAPGNRRNERLPSKYLNVPLTEVYTPIIFPGTTEPQGAFEIYQFYAPTIQRMKSLRNWVFGSIGIGFLVLYGSLVSIVWGGWRTITGQRRRLELFNNELEQQVRERTERLTREMAERRAAEITMLAQSKLAAIGQVATGVAHEINQPLTYIDGMIQTIMEDIELKALDEQHAHQVLAESHRQVERITSIIQHLRTFGRADETEYRPFNVKTALDNAILLIGERLRLGNVLLETHIDDDLPSIVGSSNQLEQVFINLFQNAADAFQDEKGSPKITVAVRSSLEQAGVEIEFSDNGIGIAPEYLGKIFDPFFSTKEVGKGTGLGLSIVYGIVRDHGGTIICNSKLDDGTTYLITLPSQGEQNV